VSVALVGALDQLTPGRRTPLEIAYIAHRIETEMLGQQSGIQDQLCAAFGGVNYIEMFDYPYAAVSPIFLPNSVWWELERRLCLIFLGKSHSSSAVHEMVIHGLEDAGPSAPARGAAPDRRTLARSCVRWRLCRAGRGDGGNTEGQRNCTQAGERRCAADHRDR
jgi:D-glycero-alpha-D-manno-heptose-7-phosphate kinase